MNYHGCDKNDDFLKHVHFRPEMTYTGRGLRSLGVTFERRGFKPGGGRRIFKDGKIQGTNPPGGTLSCLTRVVKEPQAPRGPLSKIIGHRPKFR
jgi:hypothetical protein